MKIKKEKFLLLENLREYHGFTQWEMTRKLGFKSVSSYYLIESGKKRILLSEACKICNILQINLDDLRKMQPFKSQMTH